MTLSNCFGENVHTRVKPIISWEASETNSSSSSVSKLSLDVKRNLDSETWTCAAMVSTSPDFKWQHLLARCSRLCGVWGRSLWFRLRVFTSYLLPDSCSRFSCCSFLISAALLKPFGPCPFDADLAIHTFSSQICSFSCGRHVFTLRTVWLEIFRLTIWWCTRVQKTDERFSLVNKTDYFSCSFILERLRLAPSTWCSIEWFLFDHQIIFAITGFQDENGSLVGVL